MNKIGEIEVKERRNNLNIKLIVAIIISLFVGALAMYAAFYFLPIARSQVTNQLEKEVTVTDTGISEAVDKLYDAVVVVESYLNNQEIASGSGFVYKTEGGLAYILTNTHVINNASTIYVIFTDGSRKEVSLVGKDEYSDIAVLSITDEDFSVAVIGDSEVMKLGDTVFTVGAPIDSEYSGTVTRGIVSGKDRMIEVSINTTNDFVMKVIQTDAAVNSGNSGGPLANSNGEVIGITSLKLVSSGVEGMGFAIPIEDALYYAAKIENGEEIVRPFLGVAMIDLTDLNSLYLSGIEIPENIYGVVVAEVVEDSPASKASLLKGDIICKVGDEEVTSVAELRYELYKNAPGDTIEISYVRNEKLNAVSIKLVASE